MAKLPRTVAALRRFRELEGWTQEDMAIKTCIPIATLQRIETGASKMTIDHLECYLSVLHISLIDVELAIRRGDYSKDKVLLSSIKLLSEKHKTAILNLINALI